VTTFAALAAQCLNQNPALPPDVAQGINDFAAWLDQNWQPLPLGDSDVPVPLFT
jgi:hypothetical protein